MTSRASWQTELNLSPEQWDLVLRYFPQGLSIIDLETTGLSPAFSEILEIAAINLLPTKTTAIFHEMVHPKNKIDPASTAIHGIHNEDVANAAPIEEVLPRFFAFNQSSALMAHNAIFDGGHLVYQAARHQIALPAIDVYCSCRLARYAFPKLTHHSLAFLADALKLAPWPHHQALADTVMAGKVILAAFTRLADPNFIPPTHKINKAPQLPFSDQDAAKDFMALAKNKSFLYNLNVFAPVQDATLPPHLQALPQLCTSQAIIKIKYAKGHQPHQWRPLKVTSILPTPQGMALYGFCLQSKMFKTFRVKFIEEITVLNELEAAEFAPLLPASFLKPSSPSAGN